MSLDLWYLWQVARRRRRVIGAFAALVVAATAITVLSMRPVYEARALVLIEKVGQNSLEREAVVLDSSQDDYYQTQYAILQSRSLAEKVALDLDLGKYPEFRGTDPAGSLQRGHLQIEPVRRTRLVGIVGSSRDPKLAAGIANGLAARYIEQNLENKLFLSKELLKSLDGKVSQSVKESLPAVVNSPLIQQLKGQLATLRGEWAELSKRYRPGHPRMQQLQAHVEATQNQIDREVINIVESVKIQLSGEFKGNNVHVVDQARVPDSPARPKRARLILLAIFLGVAGGFGLGLLVDRWDLTIRTPDDVEHLLKVRCLGIIKEISQPGVLGSRGFEAIWTDSRGIEVEAFRNLRAAVNFRLAQVVGPKVVLVTSALEDEGKSFVAANLARAFASAGERVLLIDGDLRRPSLHRIFSAETEHGLSGYLSNGKADPVRLGSGIPNLNLLLCGAIPDNPPELLHDERIAALLEWAVRDHDRVIVDSPPIFPIVDALLWARHAHGVLLVVAAGSARVAVVQRAQHRLREAFATVLGVAVNKVVFEPIGYYGYGYAYGYGYGAAPRAGANAASPAAAAPPDGGAKG